MAYKQYNNALKKCFTLNITFSILLSIIGCDCTRLSQDSFTYSNPGNTNPLIVLFHGLGSNASCFKSLKEALKQSFPTASVVALTRVEGIMTHICSIKEQANSSFNELLDNIPDLQHRPTLLIGHSQGGLRAYKMFDLHKGELNVKGIITLATPWEGAPALSADEKLFGEFFRSPILDDMRRLSSGLGQSIDWVEAYLTSKLQELKDGSSADGCNDLKPRSDFLNWAKDALPSETIPILAVGGGQSDFSVLLTQESNDDFQALGNAWTKVIVGKKDPTQIHDMVVPLSSQLARNIVPSENQNFKRLFIPDALHDEILPLPPIAKSKNILAHPVMFQAVKEFANEVLYGAAPVVQSMVTLPKNKKKVR